MPIITAQAELPKAEPRAAVEGVPTVTQRQGDTQEKPALSAVPPEAEKSPADADLLSPKYAALARKEKAIRQKVDELKAKEAALKAKETEYEASYIPKSKLLERLSQDPVGFLTENGLSYDQLTQAILNQPTGVDPYVRQLEAKLKALEEKTMKVETGIQDQQTKAYEQAVTQIRSEAKLLIDSDSNFETIKEMNASEAVVELIRETFDKEGVLLSVEEAAKEVENHLIEEAIKMARLRKVQAKLTPQEIAEEVQPSLATSGAQKQQIVTTKQQQPTQQQQQQMKTLTHAVSASTSSRPLSEKERIQRAILAFKGQLNS